ncbi:anthranilate synthase component II [Chitinivibrio alkaliphilus]|uniref:Anthranilate synthase component II n=1 Tax=Chitinivibrio alkaliphilus ACht1 TaxID=1313304 RepID=U7D802_9BACT|nr:aminodeoxychorismate/anthranilate synthase component II [Chitinivibrio alkaliphilus]ERP31701.1 anthranilate synthase component II [Chitinivibrio alkaliphilus ACht1]
MILLLDNYDSFTYNLAHSIREITGRQVSIFRNDEIELAEVEAYDTIILSPGPGIPDEAGILKPLIEKYYRTKNIFGVCLGYQAINEVLGGKIINLDTVYHGVATQMNVIHEDSIFHGIPRPFSAGRYHSWVIDPKTLPEELICTCEDEAGQVMGISHKEYNLRGVQFHPESILTPHGDAIIENFLRISTEI